MKFQAKDQIHISSVKSESLRPGETFEVSEALGKELLEKHPDKVRLLKEAASEKAEPAPANKADSRRKTRSG